jgi:hypothetical protein
VTHLDLERAAPPSASLVPVAEDARARVYALAGAPGRAYTSAVVVAAPSDAEVARAMADPRFRHDRIALVTDPALEGPYPGSPACSIRWVKDDPEHLVLETGAPERAFLVVADSWFPGWTATIDGQPAPLVAANLLARGLAVPPGRHVVEMRYATRGWTTGVAVTRTALAVWGAGVLLCAAWMLRERRRRGAAAASGPGG